MVYPKAMPEPTLYWYEDWLRIQQVLSVPQEPFHDIHKELKLRCGWKRKTHFEQCWTTTRLRRRVHHIGHQLI